MAEITEQELNDLFAIANAELKEAEALGGDIVVSALNELRNGTEHRVRAEQADTEEKRCSELERAKQHFIRAAYDALEARIFFSLDRFRMFQEKFSKFAENEDLPVYLDAVRTARDIQAYLVDTSKRNEFPDFSELKKKAFYLDSQLEKLSKNRKLLINSIENTKKRAKKFAVSSIAGLIASIMSALMSSYMFQGEYSKNVSDQIANLSGIQKSLSELHNYVTDQKNLLQNLNKDISSLREEKAELEQVVAIENNKIELVLKQYEKAREKEQWIDIFISFLVGVFSSTTATLILSYRKKSREAPSVDMIINTQGKSI
ncbi:MAG: hypothetical protein H7839_06795 [Magnetococcus sp. YQC-5]